jgi:hypothetical protein
MKPFIPLLLLSFFVCRVPVMAQNISGRISGGIANIKNQPIAGASVTLLHAKDAVIQKTIVSGEDGKFVFKRLPPDQYIIVITSIGYKKHTTPIITVDENHTSLVLPVIVPEPASQKVLQEVVVTAKKSLVEHKVDRTIINVDAMITAAGDNVLEALGKTPGVTVDMDGNIKLIGKGSVLVLIDDRPTHLSAQDLTAYLRSLPVGLVDKIELITNPPSRYDASGGAIINLQLKKNKRPGFHGNFMAGYNQGAYARSNGSLVLNYRKKKTNVFGNISYARDANFRDDTSRRYYYNADGAASESIFVNNQYVYTSVGWNIRTGLDHYISSNTTAGVLLTGGIRPRWDRLASNSYQTASSGTDSTAAGLMHGDYQWRSGGTNLNILHKFGSKGASLIGDLDFVNIHVGGNQFSSTTVHPADGGFSNTSGIFYNLPAAINIWSAKTDFTQPLKGKAGLEAGLKSSYVVTNYKNDTYNQSGLDFIPDYSKTNHFRYSENINAAYISAFKEWARWTIKGGLRIENIRIHGHLEGNMAVADSSFTRNYTNVFPTFYVLYRLDSSGNHTLKFNMERRIRRPNYQQLNPFLFYNDRYTYTAGNTGLNPQFVNGIWVEYNYKSRLGLAIGYMYSNQLIQSITQPSGDILITRPQNFGKDYSLNFVTYTSVDPLNAWHLNAVFKIFYLVNKAYPNEPILQNEITTGELEINNQFRISKTWGAEISGSYGSKHRGAQTESAASWNINTGVQKTILKDKATVKLSINDIFQSIIRRDKTLGIKQMTSYRTVESDTRRIGLSFSYRFGKDTNNRRRNHHSGAAEEQGRVN